MDLLKAVPAIAILVLLGGAVSLVAQADPPVRAQLIDECPAPCPEISLEKVVTLGAPTDSALFMFDTWLTAVDSGLFIASGTAEPGRLAIHGRDGRSLGVVGRLGRGPGEFGSAARVFRGAANQAWVVDTQNQRITVLDRHGNIAGNIRLDGTVREVSPLDADRAVVSGALLEAGELRHSVHVVNQAGEVVSHLGTWPPGNNTASPPAVAGWRDSLVIAPLNRYELLVAGADGGYGRLLERRVPWFTPWTHGIGPGERGATTALTNVVVDSTGHAWVFLQRPKSNPPDRPDEEHFNREYLQWALGAFDWVIELIDLSRAEVVARGVFSRAFLLPAGPGLAFSKRQDDAGYIYVDIWHLSAFP